MEWHDAVSIVMPHIVKIETPSGSGTGFLSFYTHNRTVRAIATAHHVIKHADD